MAGSTLDDVPEGQRVFLDATIFVYHFARASEQCRRLLERCERRHLFGVTSVVALAETTHRLMLIEAAAGEGHRAPRGLLRRLREGPDLVRACRHCNLAAPTIAGWGIEVLRLDLGTCLRSAEVRGTHGLLTDESLVVATMLDAGIDAIATADGDFLRVSGLRVFRPTDLDDSSAALA